MDRRRTFALALAGMLVLTGCGRTMDDIIAREPHITGTVAEVRENSILLYTKMDGYPDGAECEVSLDVENSDSYTDVSVGDEVVVYYDGSIAESDPLQIHTVYAITLETPAERAEEWDRIPMVMVDGRLYYDTGRESDREGRCGILDGMITSEVDGSQIPAEDGQSNFGAGFGYQYGDGDTIEIFMNDKWMVFEQRAGDGSQVRFDDRWIDRDGLSPETLEWLVWYQSLSEEERLMVSMVPPDLLDESGSAATEDAEAAAE